MGRPGREHVRKRCKVGLPRSVGDPQTHDTIHDQKQSSSENEPSGSGNHLVDETRPHKLGKNMGHQTDVRIPARHSGLDASTETKPQSSEERGTR